MAAEVSELESVAQQLGMRIREDDPEANARWLQSMLPNPDDWFRLCFVLGAALPLGEDTRWSELVAWADSITPAYIEHRRAVLAAGLRGGLGRRAA